MGDEIEGVRPPDHVSDGQPYWRDGEAGRSTLWATFCAECGSAFHIKKPNHEDPPTNLRTVCVLCDD